VKILCATTGERCPRGLEHAESLDWHERNGYLTDSRFGWANAANALLDQANDDALFLDDDITLTPSTFHTFPEVDQHADVIGFTLFTRGNITSAGFHALPNGDLRPQGNLIDLFRPSYVAHVTASCMWISRQVIDAGIRFPVWPGQHHEDVAFTYECWLKGFRVAYVPGVVLHDLDASMGVGATKAKLADFNQQRAVNAQCLRQWIADNDVAGAVKDGRIPTAFRGLE